jgi:MFS family permease
MGKDYTKKKISYALSYKHFTQASSATVWIIYLMKIIEACAYIAGSMILKPYLMENFNFTDYEAGVAYGIYGVQISIIGIVMGMIIDKIGVRISFLWGLNILTLARIHLSLTTNKTLLLWNLYLFLPLGTAFGIPVLTIALRRYTAKCDGGFTYSLYFVALNIGYLLGGLIVDVFRQNFPHKHPKNMVDPNKPIFKQMTAYRYINLFTALCTFIMVLIAYFKVFDTELIYIYPDNTRKVGQDIDEIPSEEVERLQRSNGDNVDKNNAAEENFGWRSRPFKNKPRKSVCSLVLYMVHQVNFWTFTLLCFLLTGVRMVFRHMDATMPQFIERELGKKIKFGLILGTLFYPSLLPALSSPL